MALLLDQILNMDPMAPEPTRVNAPVPGVGPSVPVSPTSPAAKKQGGILGALGRIFTPEPGTFWAEAWQNGLMGAKTGQAEFATGQAKIASDIAARDAQARYSNAQADRELAKPNYQISGNNVVVPGADGQPTFVTPPHQPDQVERLIDQWHAAPAGSPLQKLLERAILKSGAAYLPETIEAQGAARTKTVVAGKQAQKFAPRAAPAVKAPPARFIIQP